jgi:hypothetical protein
MEWEMNQAQALVFCVLLGVSASSCAPKEKQHESFLQVDAPFQDYVHNFETVSAQEGQSIQIDDLIVQFGDTPTLNETGVCEWADNETPKITVNERIWNTLNDYDRQEVIFHELGHCILKRVHQTSEIMGYNGSVQIAESVMYPYRISGTIYRDNIAHYNDELFDQSKRNQF